MNTFYCIFIVCWMLLKLQNSFTKSKLKEECIFTFSLNTEIFLCKNLKSLSGACLLIDGGHSLPLTFHSPNSCSFYWTKAFNRDVLKGNNQLFVLAFCLQNVLHNLQYILQGIQQWRPMYPLKLSHKQRVFKRHFSKRISAKGHFNAQMDSCGGGD